MVWTKIFPRPKSPQIIFFPLESSELKEGFFPRFFFSPRTEKTDDFLQGRSKSDIFEEAVNNTSNTEIVLYGNLVLSD